MGVRVPLGVLLCVVTLVVAGCRADGGTEPPPPPPPPPPGTLSGYYVYPPPYGLTNGSGATDAPWDLATALAGGHSHQLQAGDTVWIRGGTYPGNFRTALQGQPGSPIQFRQYPGERAIIDGSLAASGSDLWFVGFEIMQSHPLQVVDRVLEANTVNGRFINLVLHDAGFSGVSMADDAGSGVELYGCIIYNNGWRDNIDHGIYAHNSTAGTKSIRDNVVFNNFARGIQVYEDGAATIQNFAVTGNIAFNNGTIANGSTEVNLLISARALTTGMQATDNLLYFSPGEDGIQLRLGNYDVSDSALYNKGIDVENNFAVGGTLGLEMQYQWAQATVHNNVFIGNSGTDVVHTGGPAVNVYDWSGNVYYRDPAALAWAQNALEYSFNDWKLATGLGGSDSVISALPTTTVFLRPNQYEPGRAFIVVYNFGNDNPVNVDLSGIVSPGHHYDIRNVQALFDAPVDSGTYGGGPVAIPMTGVTPPRPIGRSSPRSAQRTGPNFDVFLVTSTAP
jgi:hypothetical protein